MASGIPSNNFNAPKLVKNFGANPAPSAPQEQAPPSDQVQLSGTGFAAPRVAGLAAQILQVSPDITPAEMKQLLISTSKDGVVSPEAALTAALNRSPVNLSMDETSGIGPIGDSQKADNGHGLTGLNSLNSVVSSGKFEGLNGSYGAGRNFGF